MGIIDFESILFGPKIFDLASLICSLFYYYKDKELIKKIKMIYKEYQKKEKLNETEKKYLIDLMIFNLLEQLISSIQIQDSKRIDKILLKIKFIKNNEKELKKIL